MLLVPDPRQASKAKCSRIAKAFASLGKRKPLQLLSERRMREMSYTQGGKADQLDSLSFEGELDMPDRRELDDAVLEMLGVKPKRERQRLIVNSMTTCASSSSGRARKKKRLLENKKRAKRKGPASPADVALQVYQELLDREGYLLRQYEPDFLDASKPFDTYEVHRKGQLKSTQTCSLHTAYNSL